MSINYCAKCLIPDSRPGTTFDHEGVCQACRVAEQRARCLPSSGVWDESKLADLFSWARSEADNANSLYDCIVPISGGKDSIFQVDMAIRHGLRVLGVNAVPLARSQLRAANMDVIRQLGADVIEIDIRRPDRARLSRSALLDVGIPNWPQHILSVTAPFHVAIDMGIKLILWGENPEQEYGGPQDLASLTEMTADWFARRGGAEAASIKKMEELTGLHLDGDRWFSMPNAEVIKRHGIKAAFLGQHTQWDSLRSWFVALGCGFETASKVPQGALWPFENLDDPLYLFHDWIKFLKYGFGRASDHASISVRQGLMSREDAGRIIARLEGRFPEKYLEWSVEQLLDLLELDLDEFDELCGKIANKDLFRIDINNRLIIDNGRPRLTDQFLKARELAGIVES